MANFFEQFHDAPEQGAPAGTANFFSQFHPEDAPKRVIIDVTPKRPDNGVADAIGRGVASGATAGFGDELRGLIEAGGANPDDPASIYKLLHGALKYWGGDEDAKKRYDETVLREREADKAAEENHPIVHGIGEVAGAIATLPVLGGPSQAATWTGRAAAAAKQGAVYGGLSGAGEGEGAKDTVIRAAGGTLLGGAAGAVAAPLIEGAGKLIQKGGQKAGNTYRGAMDPDAEAARQYATAYRADRIDDPTFRQRMTPPEFQGSPDARLIDLGGGHMRRLADASGIIAPGGEMKLKGAIDDRFKGQTNRFTDWFREHFHYPDAYGQGQALDEVAKNVNRPAYRKAFEDGDKPIMSPKMEILMSSPKVVRAMKAASTSGKDRAVTEGYGAFNPAVKVTDDGRVVFNKGADGAPTFPNLQFWDQTRRELSQAAQKAKQSGALEDAEVYGKLARHMNEELDLHVPSYQAARQGAAGFFGADNALEAGVKFVSDSKMGLSEARARLAKMSPAERRLFQDGFVDEYLRAVINKTGDNRDVLLKIANNPEARGKLELVMGRDRMNMLEAKIRVEQMFDQVRKAVQGQSITAKRLYDLGMAGGAGLSADGGYNTDPKEIAYGAVIAALSSGGKRINAQVATRLVDMMLSRDPMVVEKGFKLISSDPKWLGALRDADTKIGRVISGVTPTSPVLQLTGAVRADDQKPGVKRPIGR